MHTKGSATYCPEDNKLRLYVGRVPREEYLDLKAAGFTSTPKQACDFVATWSPDREDIALQFAEIIEDEDQTPEERAADRAERFSEYRDKRLSEAVGHADRFDAGPSVHGFQDYGRAVRSADRHDRIAGRAVSAWDKAEYWTRRTAGVISHALYKAEPGVRMGRINMLESELRKTEATLSAYRKAFTAWKRVEAITDPAEQFKAAYTLSNFYETSGGYDYKHPRPETVTNERIKTHGTSLLTLLTLPENPITGAEAAALWLSGRTDPDSEAFQDSGTARWIRHYNLRLAYERQMLEAVGGMLEQKEVEVGGRFGGNLILKVNKSAVTKRPKSVAVLTRRVQSWTYRVRNIPGTDWAEAQFDLERSSPDMYQPPTPESLKELEEVRTKIKGARPKVESVPLINPTDADAARLQELLNKNEPKSYCAKTPEVVRMTQERYSELSKGTFARFETAEITGGGFKIHKHYMAKRSQFPAVVKVRMGSGSVVILTDKPQKPFPDELWHDPRPEIVEECMERAAEIRSLCGSAWSSDWDEDQKELMTKAQSVGLVNWASVSQVSLTDKGWKLLAQPVTA